MPEGAFYGQEARRDCQFLYQRVVHPEGIEPSFPAWQEGVVNHWTTNAIRISSFQKLEIFWCGRRDLHPRSLLGRQASWLLNDFRFGAHGRIFTHISCWNAGVLKCWTTKRMSGAEAGFISSLIPY